MSKPEEIDELREKIAALEGRVTALGLALQVSVIVADDALRHHRKGIVKMLDDLRLSHCPPNAQAALAGFINSIDRIRDAEDMEA